MGKDQLLLLSHIYSSHTPSYGDRDEFKIEQNSSILRGDSSNTSSWILTNNHIGTHIDAPYHFDATGMKTTDYACADWLFKKVTLIEIPCNSARMITAEDMKSFKIDSDTELLLIRTHYEKYRSIDKYWNDNPGLTESLANYLRTYFPHIRCIGFDFISITSWKHRNLGESSHKAFLAPQNRGKPILAIEDMSLKNIQGNIEWVIVAPIFVEEGNGGPVTVIANINGS